MKKILLTIVGFLSLLSPALVNAQATFTVQADTVNVSFVNGGGLSPNDLITNTSATGGLTLRWRVTACNFPSEWLTSAAFGICDNQTCYYNNGDTALWNGTTHAGETKISNPYPYNTVGSFNLSLNLPNTVSSGIYYVTINILDPGSLYSRNVTFMLNNTVTAVSNVTNSLENILLYPNPASNEVNVVYNTSSDVQSIAVYNIIGKVMRVYKGTGNSATLDLENIPSGIYFVRLMNLNGDPIATRKFTKQ
jgi:hypothetical protein